MNYLHSNFYIYFIFTKYLGRYRRISSGSCGSNGMQPITSFQECNIAAQAIGYVDLTASEAVDSPRPEGCYYNGRLWLATNPVNKGNGADSSRKPICKTAG